MTALMTRFANVYCSDVAFTGGLLLAFGVIGASTRLWLRLLL